MAAIGVERGDLLRRNVEYHVEVSDVFNDGFRYGSDARVGEGKLCLSIACQGAGYLRIGPALDALEQEAAGLGAAFYWTLVRSLYRVMRIYDHEDATMYEENLRAYADEDDSGEQYEFPEVKRALPPYIAATLDRGKEARVPEAALCACSRATWFLDRKAANHGAVISASRQERAPSARREL
jgi:hypothetical protein